MYKVRAHIYDLFPLRAEANRIKAHSSPFLKVVMAGQLQEMQTETKVACASYQGCIRTHLVPVTCASCKMRVMARSMEKHLRDRHGINSDWCTWCLVRLPAGEGKYEHLQACFDHAKIKVAPQVNHLGNHLGFWENLCEAMNMSAREQIVREDMRQRRILERKCDKLEQALNAWNLEDFGPDM